MRSFTKLEKSISSNLRAKLSLAEDVPDVVDLFCDTMATFFDEAVSEVSVTPEDFAFDPDSPYHFKIESDLMDNPDFNEIWKNSDLKAIAGRFAESCYKRYLHLERHPEKTKSKIRMVT